MGNLDENKTGLVLEGGGMRGAYTAGALAWLNDNHVTFDYGVGISSGAVYLSGFWQGDKHTPHNMSVYYGANPNTVGIRALLHSGYYVDYGKIFDDDILGKEKFTIQPLKDMNANIEFGAYNMEKGITEYFGVDSLDDKLTILRASVALPIASAMVKVNGVDYLDGGIIRMIPIERSVEQGVKKHLVITTKNANYVRKPANKIVIFLMKLIYRKYPKIVQNYKERHIRYYEQIHLIDELVEKDDAILIRPSKEIEMSRFKGSEENAKKLYDLGYQDMEAQKDKIFEMFCEKEVTQNIQLEEKEKAVA